MIREELVKKEWTKTRKSRSNHAWCTIITHGSMVTKVLMFSMIIMPAFYPPSIIIWITITVLKLL
jgi:hypothetical protein